VGSRPEGVGPLDRDPIRTKAVRIKASVRVRELGLRLGSGLWLGVGLGFGKDQGFRLGFRSSRISFQWA